VSTERVETSAPESGATTRADSAIGDRANKSSFSAAAGCLPGQLDTAEDCRIVPWLRPRLEDLRGDRRAILEAVGLQL